MNRETPGVPSLVVWNTITQHPSDPKASAQMSPRSCSLCRRRLIRYPFSSTSARTSLFDWVSLRTDRLLNFFRLWTVFAPLFVRPGTRTGFFNMAGDLCTSQSSGEASPRLSYPFTTCSSCTSLIDFIITCLISSHLIASACLHRHVPVRIFNKADC